VVTADLPDLTAPELRQEILKLRRRVEKLPALLRLALALVHASSFRLSGERLPDGPAKERILRAVENRWFRDVPAGDGGTSKLTGLFFAKRLPDQAKDQVLLVGLGARQPLVRPALVGAL
jgi:hypothetical protein